MEQDNKKQKSRSRCPVSQSKQHLPEDTKKQEKAVSTKKQQQQEKLRMKNQNNKKKNDFYEEIESAEEINSEYNCSEILPKNSKASANANNENSSYKKVAQSNSDATAILASDNKALTNNNNLKSLFVEKENINRNNGSNKNQINQHQKQQLQQFNHQQLQSQQQQSQQQQQQSQQQQQFQDISQLVEHQLSNNANNNPNKNDKKRKIQKLDFDFSDEDDEENKNNQTNSSSTPVGSGNGGSISKSNTNNNINSANNKDTIQLQSSAKKNKKNATMIFFVDKSSSQSHSGSNRGGAQQKEKDNYKKDSNPNKKQYCIQAISTDDKFPPQFSKDFLKTETNKKYCSLRTKTRLTVLKDINSIVLGPDNKLYNLLDQNYFLSNSQDLSSIPQYKEGVIECEKNLLPPNTVKQKIQCNCKKTKCLKLYCDCFRQGEYCKDCNCQDCENVEKNKEERDRIFKSLSARGNVQQTIKQNQQIEEDEESAQIPKGCNCKKSNCQKKYCECYDMGVQCTEKCNCEQCKNRDYSYYLQNKLGNNRNKLQIKQGLNQGNSNNAVQENNNNFGQLQYYTKEKNYNENSMLQENFKLEENSLSLGNFQRNPFENCSQFQNTNTKMTLGGMNQFHHFSNLHFQISNGLMTNSMANNITIRNSNYDFNENQNYQSQYQFNQSSQNLGKIIDSQQTFDENSNRSNKSIKNIQVNKIEPPIKDIRENILK